MIELVFGQMATKLKNNIQMNNLAANPMLPAGAVHLAEC